MLSNLKQTGFSSWHLQMVKIALRYFAGLLQVGLPKCLHYINIFFKRLLLQVLSK